ncbi:2-hydroxyglutaryl-CoA dehydratase [Candidatus Thorarchaeota archaeon]|nr:MAG: 2-hydroxyglutaryl-CoA dehydratase [Candidatus Thorarchaeota archaeon]
MDEPQEVAVGIDVGSTTTKGVMLDANSTLIASYLLPTGASALSSALKCLSKLSSESGVSADDTTIVSTGYGRLLVDFAHTQVTEITCHSIGVHHLNPGIRLLIDVGGQDSKVIRIGKNGKPTDFELNDKCSAGTGRFLEVMARVLEVSIDELGPLALKSDSPSTISSTCTVFAESEVIGHIGDGASPEDIAAGVHQSMASKISTLSRRVGIVPPIGLTGGVALNPAFRHYLGKQMKAELWCPETPQHTGALGAALLAMRTLS